MTVVYSRASGSYSSGCDPTGIIHLLVKLDSIRSEPVCSPLL